MTEIERYLILVEGEPPANYSAWSPDVLFSLAGLYFLVRMRT